MSKRTGTVRERRLLGAQVRPRKKGWRLPESPEEVGSLEDEVDETRTGLLSGERLVTLSSAMRSACVIPAMVAGR